MKPGGVSLQRRVFSAKRIICSDDQSVNDLNPLGSTGEVRLRQPGSAMLARVTVGKDRKLPIGNLRVATDLRELPCWKVERPRDYAMASGKNGE